MQMKPRPTDKQVQGVFATWKELTKLHDKRGKLVLQILSHPEGTLEMVEPFLPDIKATADALRKHKPVVLDLLNSNAFLYGRQIKEVEEWRP